jgi:hypothetical protein
MRACGQLTRVLFRDLDVVVTLNGEVPFWAMVLLAAAVLGKRGDLAPTASEYWAMIVGFAEIGFGLIAAGFGAAPTTWMILKKAKIYAAPAPDPLDWLTMLHGFSFVAGLVAAARRGIFEANPPRATS